MTGRDHNLAGRLRAETAELHAATEDIVGVPHRVQTRPEYVRLLKLLAVFYSSTQLAMEDARWRDGWHALDIDISAHSRVDLLRSDLRELGTEPDTASSDALPIDTFGAALGCLYVVEGSSLGGIFIGPIIKKTVGDVPTAFYDGVGRGHPRPWQRVRTALATYGTENEQVDDVIRGAEAAFVRFGEVARAERWAATPGG